MSGKTSPAQTNVTLCNFYGESPPKRSRLQDSNLRPAFKSLKDNLIKFDRKLSEPVSSPDLKPLEEPESGEEAKNLDRDSPLPLKNLGNTCYENSIIQCLFNLNMFMDNFERSMKKMRQLVLRPKVSVYGPFEKDHLYDKQETTSDLGEEEDEIVKCSESSESSHKGVSTDVSQIDEHDVRYRIADAFDNLYKSYTQKRIQIESTANSTNLNSNSHQNDQLDVTTTTSDSRPDSAISMSSSTAIPLCKSSNHTGNANSTTFTTSTTNIQDSCVDNNQVSTFVTSSIQTDNTVSNLTPIALVSSATTTTNEQSEIEKRLEDLKSAVGERSSQFNSAHQQDASEFFYHVIDSIQEFYQAMDKNHDDNNPVTKAFELELDYLVRCPKCQHKVLSEPEKIRTLPLALPHVNSESSRSQDELAPDSGAPTTPTSDLGLDSPKSNSSDEQRNGLEEKENKALVEDVPIEQDNSNNTMSIAKLELTDKSENITQNSQQKPQTICDALNNYFKDDLLEYNCSQPNCDSKHKTKKCLIRKLPQVLFITLARYSYTGKKNLDEIEAPFELSVPFQENKSPSHSPSSHHQFSDDDNQYQLVAVVCHLGSSLNAGHYTSYVYNQNNSFWYSCDDDSITKVEETTVKNDASKSGYCFFYAHKSCVV